MQNIKEIRVNLLFYFLLARQVNIPKINPKRPPNPRKLIPANSSQGNVEANSDSVTVVQPIEEVPSQEIKESSVIPIKKSPPPTIMLKMSIKINSPHGKLEV